jgi:serine/threonine protein phosphatase PrpC
MEKSHAQPGDLEVNLSELVDTEPEIALDSTGLEKVGDGVALSLTAALRTDVGLVRAINEDSCLLYSFDAGGHHRPISFGLYLVADGMGGHESGEKASNIASRTAAHHLLQEVYLPFISADLVPEAEIIETKMSEAVQAAHEAVHPPGHEGNGGTTLTVAMIIGRWLYIAHVGDSRAYRLVEQRLEALTRDHSLVQRLQDSGKLTPEEARDYQYRNVLLRALGQADALEVDFSAHALPTQGKLLLCSDGLCGQVAEGELERIMNLPHLPGAIADQLVAAALGAGGLDNISAIVVEFRPY